MNEIKSVKLKLTSVMPRVGDSVHNELEDAFWRYADVYGIPTAVVSIMDICEQALTNIMQVAEDNSNYAS